MKKVCPICKAEYLGGEVFCPVDAARLITPSQIGMEGPLTDDALVGSELDRYRVIRRIGEGGMGLVYEGLHIAIEKRVAIKVLRDDFSSRPDVVERFRQEAKSASRIGHENIVDISDFGSTPAGQSYFVMEFLEGEDLADLIAREGTLSVERILDISGQCARALSAAHSKGIVHRDMKPENIFLTQRPDRPDFPKIVDFGIAKMSDIETSGAPGRKLTKTGMIFGTPEYMSPEQAAGKGLDHRVDIYGMGVIMYELVTGRVPFVGDTFMGVLTQHLFEAPPPLREVNAHVECSRELELIIFKCLSKSADGRYATMDKLAEALDDAKFGKISEATLVGYGDPVKAKARPPRPGVASVPPPASTGSRVGLWAGAVVTVLAIASGIFWLGTRGQEEEPVTVAALADAGVALDAGDPALDAEGPEVDAGEPDVPVEPEVEPEPTLVALTFETETPGARLVFVGHDELECESTPCTVEVLPGEALEVQARRGQWRGELEVTPDEASTLEIPMRRRRVAPRNGGDTTMIPAGMGMWALMAPDWD
ncbi:MAG: serine/threonine-protein kinase [Polyangiales bacterium]